MSNTKKPANAGTKQDRNSRGQFVKGVSGNSKGKARGTRHRATQAALELMNGQLEQITQNLINAAIDGDVTAIKIVIDKLIPQAKELPLQGVSIPTVDTASDLPKATAAILDAVASGELLPSQGQALAGLVTNHAKAIEVAEFETRLATLEKQASEDSDNG